MADFSFNSDSSDDAAVEELLNQAMDHSVLEQIAKINCSSFSSDSALPTHLENRFSRLKSFPVSNLKSPNFLAEKKFNSQFMKKPEGKHDPDSGDEFGGNESNRDSRSGSDNFPSKVSKSTEKGKLLRKTELQSYSDDEFEENPVEGNEVKQNSRSGSDYFSPKSSRKGESLSKGRGFEKNLGTGFGSSRSDSSTSSIEDLIREKKKLRSRKKETELLSSRSNSSDFSPSPPRKWGCFLCLPKKSSVKKPRGIDRELLSDLSILSAKNQLKLLEKSMREEEKIKREAEKIVEWAKQGSARMNISDIDD